MKKIIYTLSSVLLFAALISCGGKGQSTSNESITVSVPEHKIIERPQVNLTDYKQDQDGYYILFDGTDMKGWRGYGREDVPKTWTVDNGAIKFNGSGGGEAQDSEGGDLIFAHKFKNFELELEWTVSKGGNSGIFFLAQEVETKDPSTGSMRSEPIYISSPEYQILDNENHPDARLGKDNNRKAGSLYDMIPAKPQNAKPFGEWNKAKIMVYKGTVIHGQNDTNVVEYHLWTQQWTDMLQESKFSKDKWPLAFELLNNVGGDKREGYIGFQDHGDDVWFRNIRIKIME